VNKDAQSIGFPLNPDWDWHVRHPDRKGSLTQPITASAIRIRKPDDHHGLAAAAVQVAKGIVLNHLVPSKYSDNWTQNN
jgi:hypothetical protein